MSKRSCGLAPRADEDYVLFFLNIIYTTPSQNHRPQRRRDEPRREVHRRLRSHRIS
jgi:hypothetical protein